MDGKVKRPAWEIVLLVLGSPVWASLLIAAIAVIFAVYVSLWAVIISLWSVVAVFGGSALGGAVMGVVQLCNGNLPAGVALIGAGLVCAGLAILWFFLCRITTRGMITATKALWLRMKNSFRKEREAV